MAALLRLPINEALGARIARAYARAHGGDIVSEPAMPHGARFEVVLPLRVEEAAV